MTVSGATAWANPGLLIWVAAFGGYITITGVIGNLITFRNLTVPAGSVVIAGTQLIAGPPPQETAEAEASTVTVMSSVNGAFNGLPVNMVPVPGEMLHGGATGWMRFAASPFRHVPSHPVLLDMKRDVLASTAGATSATRFAGPVWGGTGTPAPSTVTFPNVPTGSGFAGLQIRALVQCDWEMACLAAGSLCVEVTINGVTNRIVQYCSTISATLSGLAANIRHEGPSGIFQTVIPVPADNSPVNVTTYVRKNELTTGALDANTHYKFTYRIIGYYF